MNVAEYNDKFFSPYHFKFFFLPEIDLQNACYNIPEWVWKRVTYCDTCFQICITYILL